VILERRLSRADHVDSEFDVAYGICVRRLAEWPGARKAFARAIQRAGQAGQFAEQSRAILELAILCRYQGDYTRTASLLRRADRTASRAADEVLRQSIHEELAQVYVDKGDVAQANRYLTRCQNESGRKLVLCAEVELQVGKVQACLALAERALQFYEDNRPAAARVHTLIARSHYLAGDLDKAHEHFATALAHLELCGDAQ
jgi:tetratricopeptide (TPR) repeat protein